jgi:hypothetical protein
MISFLLIIVIGIAAGLIFDQLAGPGWLTRQIAGPNRTMVTSALVGIAGSFIGHYVGIMAGIVGFAALIFAAIGAAAVLWGWRMVR